MAFPSFSIITIYDFQWNHLHSTPVPRHQIVFPYSLLGVHFLYSGLLLLPLLSRQPCSSCSSSTSRLFRPRVNDNASRGDVRSIKELLYLQAFLFSFFSVFLLVLFTFGRKRYWVGFRIRERLLLSWAGDGYEILPSVNITSVAGCFPSAFSILKDYGRNPSFVMIQAVVSLC